MSYNKNLKISGLDGNYGLCNNYYNEDIFTKDKCFEKYINIITHEQNKINQILSKYNFKIDWKFEYKIYSQSKFELECNSKEDFNNIVNLEILNVYIKTLDFF